MSLKQKCAKCGDIKPYSSFYWIKGRKKPTTTCTICRNHMHNERIKIKRATQSREVKRSITGVREKKHDIPHEEYCSGCELYRVTTDWHYPSCYYSCLRRGDLG